MLNDVENTVNREICAGASFAGYSIEGIYMDVFTAENGCDSIRWLNLTVLPSIVHTISAQICEGEELEGYTETGVYSDTFIAVDGCDSTRILELIVLPSDDSACVTTIGNHLFHNILKIYPNPFQEDFYIACDCQGDFSYQLFDIMGGQIGQGKIDFSHGIVSISNENLSEAYRCSFCSA